MTEQPTALALRLADAMSLSFPGNLGIDKAAAELRRIHAENRALTDALFQAQEAAKALLAQRDALLEACRAYDKWAGKTRCYDQELRPIRAQIRAAIKAVEEGK